MVLTVNEVFKRFIVRRKLICNLTDEILSKCDPGWSGKSSIELKMTGVGIEGQFHEGMVLFLKKLWCYIRGKVKHENLTQKILLTVKLPQQGDNLTLCQLI